MCIGATQTAPKSNDCRAGSPSLTGPAADSACVYRTDQYWGEVKNGEGLTVAETTEQTQENIRKGNLEAGYSVNDRSKIADKAAKGVALHFR
jgi:hypothetical protein